ncbi:asparagine synthase-related protein [Massilia niabensis]|uniref:asparagine synthase (glutamine-hydrolyzing) n=1 Tax=Massilia niabensis TaxID=544910 RepID=A0ABW0LB89_9BURK
MTGLCGWFSTEPPALPLADMAAPFGVAVPLRTGVHSLGAAAVSGGSHEAALYHEDGLLIAHWGERVDGLAELARLWRTHGAQACAALSGHFAFAIVDERRAEALLAVDRCATRPLFYQTVGRTLLFASSMETLARHPGAGRELDPQAVFDYLYLNAVHGPRTMHAGARRLAPGERLHLRAGRFERMHYWRMRYTEHAAHDAPHGALADALHCALGAGRTSHSPSQRPVGLMFAGGAGSALLAARLGRAAEAAPATYTVGYGHQAGAMLNRARANAGRLGTWHRETVIDADDVADAVAALALASDAPCGDPAAVAMLFAARMAREDGVRRLACGIGAAQLFGCSQQHASLARAGRYERLPGALRQLLIEPLLFGAAARLPGAFERMRERIELSMAPAPMRLRRGNALLAHGTAAVFEPGFLELVDPGAPGAAQEQAWWLAQGRSSVNRAVNLELQGDLPCRLLPAFTAACSSSGVAPAFPYLHDAVVAMSACLAPRHKTPGGARDLFARALREAGVRLSVTPDPAPPLPFGTWLQGDARLRALAYDSLAALAGRGIVRREFIDLLLARRLPEDPVLHGRTVWQLMMLEAWFARRRHGGFAPAVTNREAAAPAQADSNAAAGVALPI